MAATRRTLHEVRKEAAGHDAILLEVQYRTVDRVIDDEEWGTDDGVFVLHTAPEDALHPTTPVIDLPGLASDRFEFQRLGRDYASSGDIRAQRYEVARDGDVDREVIRLYDSGILEVISTHITRSRADQPPAYPPKIVENTLPTLLHNYGEAMENHADGDPSEVKATAMWASFTGVEIAVDRPFTNAVPVPMIDAPVVVVDVTASEEEIKSDIKPVSTAFWNAVGNAVSPYYED